MVIGLNSDASVNRLKGPSRPKNYQHDRKTLLEELSCVDEVIIFEDDTPYELINRLKPDIIVKGGDYSPSQVVGKEIVESYGGQVVIIPLLDGYSTTSILGAE